ncbi:Na/H antiporter [Oryctes borbonicus]|uniref:Na/H antiporter n=1 Tax=Oryctes borbonicus TaxID=1629725 RepID=A0A0T6BHQ0_9SCAR|nr:Na/H antiporter [Oryctes borbonicus]
MAALDSSASTVIPTKRSSVIWEPDANVQIPVRKISLKNPLHGFDNPTFDSPRSRKISTASSHEEVGPVRKKSCLHNPNFVTDAIGYDTGKCANGNTRTKKLSTSESVHSKTRFSDIADEDGDDRSWWYTFCLKCRARETHPSWQPPIWSKICPYPFCLTYRQFSRIVALSLIGVLLWAVLYTIVGDTAAPGGLLFQLILLALCAHFGGFLMSLTTLPPLIGMLITGLVLQNVGIVDINESFGEVTKELRKIALVIILIRAGLDLDPLALKRLKFITIKVGLVPWVVEAVVITLTTHFLLDLPWIWAVMLGVLIAAVSPAVVVSCLFRLRSKGYGVAKGIPTLIIAVAGIDDATSVAMYGILQSIMFSNDSLTSQIIQGPVSVVGGIGFGILWGIISNYAPEKFDPFVVPLRILMLLVGGLVSVFGSEMIGYGGAGPLACVTAAFVSLVCWSRSGWEIDDNPAATAFEIFWMIFEPILFSITGAQIKINELDPHIIGIGTGCLIAGIILRMLVTLLVGIGCGLNLKEKIFVSLSLMAKATVQAALGPVALGFVLGQTPQQTYGETVLMICVLSIMITAPTGAILITITGPRLLTKTKLPAPTPEGWRRSHRPSIRDISIIDEEEERHNNIENQNTINIEKDSP